MKASELMQELEKVPPEREVCVCIDGEDYKVYGLTGVGYFKDGKIDKWVIRLLTEGVAVNVYE